MKDKRKTKAQSIPLHFIAQGVIPAFIVIIAVLAILDIKVVFEPPLLLFILNTLFISVVSFAVASISANNYLKRGSLSFLLLGCGVLVLGSGSLVAGWLIGPPGGPNVNVTIYDTGALLGAVFHATGAIFASAGVTSDRILVLKRKSTVILAYLGVLVFMALLTIASIRGAIPPYIVQGIGPTLLGRVVLGTAVALFGISSLFLMRLYSKSKETFQYWYSLALALIAVGLSAVFLQKAVGSPIGWAGRSAQYLGGIYFLIAVLITYMEGRLRISEEKLRSVFASSPDAITVIDLNGNILECSQSALDIHGCSSKDEVLGKNAFEFIAKKDHEKAMESLKKTLEQGSVKDIEYTFLTKDGCEFPVELSASVIKDSYGDPTGFVVMSRDITERKRAEEALRESQQLLERTFASLEEAVFVVDPTTRTVVVCNPAVERIFGYNEKEVIGKNTEFLHVDRRMYERFGQELFPALDADGVFRTEFQLRRKDGDIFISEHTVTEIVDDSGHRTGVVSVVRDITERVRAEEALRESEERYRSLFEGVPVGLYRTTPGGQILDGNPALVEMLGYPDRQALLAVNVTDVYLDPEERRRWQALMERKGVVRDFEAQLRRHDGTIIWGQDSARAVRDGEGRVLYYEGAVEDITERKRAEEALGLHSEMIANMAEGAMLVRTSDAEILYTNPRFEEMFGYGPGELIGKNVSILNAPRPGKSAEEIREEIIATLNKCGVWSGEIQNSKKDGTPFWCRANVSTLESSQHGTVWVAVHEDITKRKRAEEALYQRADDMAALYETSQVFLSHLDTEVIIEGMCRLAVDRFGLKMAWVGLVVEGSFDVRPALAYGFDEGYLDSIRVTWDDSPTGRGPTGTAIRTGQATVMNHIESDPTYAPWREAAKARGYRSSAALPLCHGEQVLGALNVYSAEPVYFTAERVQVLQSFANQAAVAIQNARLFEQVRAGRERLQTLSRQLLEVQEAERRHIACELHDEVGQALTGLKLLLDMSTRLPADEVTASLGEAQAMVNELMTLVRDLSLDLRPAMLDDLGLLPTLLWHFDRYTAQTRVHVTFKHTGLQGRFAPEVETAAYRIVQEALTNVARHAGVREVTVRLWTDQDTLGVQIEDRGTGFDPEAERAVGDTTGLAGMRERAVLLGGQLTVESTPGAGTRVTAELPLGDPVEEGERGRGA